MRDSLNLLVTGSHTGVEREQVAPLSIPANVTRPLVMLLARMASHVLERGSLEDEHRENQKLQRRRDATK